MAYDGFRHNVVLFGGVDANDLTATQTLNDTWTFQGQRWTERDPSTRPGPLAGAQMAYDEVTHGCLLVWSGSRAGLATTWQWDGTTWSRLPNVPFGTDESFQALASDPTTGHALLVSTVITANDLQVHTWTWDGREWALRHPPQPLPAPEGTVTLASIGATAGDRLGRGILALVPIAQGNTETWVWDGATWSPRAMGATPPYIPFNATMAEDPATESVTLIGVDDPVNGGNGSTWLWNGQTWSQSGVAPLIGDGATAAMSDDVTGHAIVFGDRTPDSRANEFNVLWIFDGQGWDSGRPG
jgi:hypothetical protein